jgi:NTP pyrophosphatase (non-canonical NTP hydrolase)
MLENLEQTLKDLWAKGDPPDTVSWYDEETQQLKHLSYARMVGCLAKEMGHETLNMLHAAVGVSGESGELIDAVKKVWVYNKEVDLGNIIEEMGDIEFYLQYMRIVLGLSRQQILSANARKLGKRYAAGHYSDAAAQARADKQNGE